jgi:hypothetical protein
VPDKLLALADEVINEAVLLRCMSPLLKADIPTCVLFVRFEGDCVAKLFSRPNWAILIQGRAKARNIDSKHRSVGFDNCSFAAQRRVLQHNQG